MVPRQGVVLEPYPATPIHMVWVALQPSSTHLRGERTLAALSWHLQARLNTELAEQLREAREAAMLAEQLAHVRAQEIALLRGRAAEAEAGRAAAEQRVVDCETVRRRLHNTILVQHALLPYYGCN